MSVSDVTYHAASIVGELQSLNRSYSQQTFFHFEKDNTKMPGSSSPYHFLVKNAPSCFGEHYWRYSRVRDCLLPPRVLAVCRGFRAAVDTAACASRISNLSISGSTPRILPMLIAVPCGLCQVLPIDIRYESGIRCSIHCSLLIVVASRFQVPSIRYQVFDTANTRSISAYILRLLPVVTIEYFT